jgi:hypothetical protein
MANGVANGEFAIKAVCENVFGTRQIEQNEFA